MGKRRTCSQFECSFRWNGEPGIRAHVLLRAVCALGTCSPFHQLNIAASQADEKNSPLKRFVSQISDSIARNYGTHEGFNITHREKES